MWSAKFQPFSEFNILNDNIYLGVFQGCSTFNYLLQQQLRPLNLILDLLRTLSGSRFQKKSR